MPVFSRSIRKYLLAAMACLIVPGVGAIGVMMHDAANEVSTDQMFATLVKADRALLAAGIATRSQRGQFQTALQVDDAPRKLLEKLLGDAKTQIATAIDALQATSLPDRAALAAAIQAKAAGAESFTTANFAEADKPKAQRSLAVTLPWYNAVSETEAAVLAASTATSNAVRLSEPALADLQAFKSAAWSVRSHYGSQCSTLRPIINSGVAMTTAQVRNFAETRGATSAGLAQLKQLASRPGVAPVLVQKVDTSVLAVEGATKRADELIGKLGAGSGPVMAADEWTRMCNAPFDPILATVSQAFDDMDATMTTRLRQAWIKLGVLAGLLALLAIVGLMSWRGMRSRIALPLTQMKDALDRMQGGDLTQEAPRTPCPDEVGALSSALERYRQNARSLDDARQEREFAMSAEAEQSATMQALVRDVAVIVAAARHRDFSGRADTGQVTGPMRELAEGVNEINALVNSATGEFVDVLQSLAQGDLTRNVSTA